jgi:hypothetical protein
MILGFFLQFLETRKPSRKSSRPEPLLNAQISAFLWTTTLKPASVEARGKDLPEPLLQLLHTLGCMGETYGFSIIDLIDKYSGIAA